MLTYLRWDWWNSAERPNSTSTSETGHKMSPAGSAHSLFLWGPILWALCKPRVVKGSNSTEEWARSLRNVSGRFPSCHGHYPKEWAESKFCCCVSQEGSSVVPDTSRLPRLTVLAGLSLKSKDWTSRTGVRPFLHLDLHFLMAMIVGHGSVAAGPWQGECQ